MLTLFKNITEELTDLEKQTVVPSLLELVARTNERTGLQGKELYNVLL